jgi:NADH-quinone oxidoreductase subunit G
MEAIRWAVQYDFVEIMAVRRLLGGGGQPIHDGEELAGTRSTRLYDLDRTANLRFSHENPSVLKLYEDYFEKPLSEKSHHLLHTDHHGWKMPREQ